MLFLCKTLCFTKVFQSRLTGKCKCLLSILAGTKLETLKKQIKSKYYIRTMPNIAASVQNSMTTITGDNEAKTLAMEIFNSIGQIFGLILKIN